MNPYSNFKYFNDPSPFAEQHLMVSDGMGYECNPSFLIDRSYFNNNLIMFVLSGELYVEQFDTKYTLTAMQGILMDLTQAHKYYFDKARESHMIWFHFRGKACQELLDELHANRRLPVVFSADGMEHQIYELFDTTSSTENTKEFGMSSKIYSMILNVTKKSVMELHTENKDFNRFQNEVDNYLSANLYVKLSLGEMAKHFQMSKYHFCRKFKEQLRTTPFEYIKIRKLEIAKKMLIHTNDSISEIANYLCFYDQGYFSNVFKEYAGCSPRRFRLENK